MAYFFDFASSQGILRCRLEGDITNESLKKCYEAAGALAAQIDPKVGIMDFSNVNSLDVSAETVRDLANRAPGMPKARPRFLVAPSHSLYGLARMFQQYGSETRPDVYLVRSMDEVYAILGVLEPHFEPVTGRGAIRQSQSLTLLKPGRTMVP